MTNRIIVIDDDPDYLALLGSRLAELGYADVTQRHDPVAVAAEFDQGARYDLALIDMTMPGMSGLELLAHIRGASPDTECIIVTAVNEARVAVDCLRMGAYDYLLKPVPADALALAINRTLERKRLLDILGLDKGGGPLALDRPEPFAPIVTRSPNVRRVLREAELHAGSSVPILITGESGTGKELLARAIHLASPRASHPFTPINMASLTPTLFEAEFFGHTKGAFTGAEAKRAGYLEHTHKGTLFLDEIGDLSVDLQGKLLRVLQEGEYSKLGSSRREQVDLRLIAATNENLDQMMSRKLFRKDLYYRIRGGWLHLPPLRERPDDVPLLVARFLDRPDDATGPGVEGEALELLQRYAYPGNVRELRSIVRASANLARGRPIAAHHLPDALRTPPPPKTHRGAADDGVANDEATLPLAEVERTHILRAYLRLDRNKSRTARALGIGLNTLRRKLDAYGVT